MYISSSTVGDRTLDIILNVCSCNCLASVQVSISSSTVGESTLDIILNVCSCNCLAGVQVSISSSTVGDNTLDIIPNICSCNCLASVQVSILLVWCCDEKAKNKKYCHWYNINVHQSKAIGLTTCIIQIDIVRVSIHPTSSYWVSQLCYGGLVYLKYWRLWFQSKLKTIILVFSASLLNMQHLYKTCTISLQCIAYGVSRSIVTYKKNEIFITEHSMFAKFDHIVPSAPVDFVVCRSRPLFQTLYKVFTLIYINLFLWETIDFNEELSN